MAFVGTGLDLHSKILSDRSQWLSLQLIADALEDYSINNTEASRIVDNCALDAAATGVNRQKISDSLARANAFVTTGADVSVGVEARRTSFLFTKEILHSIPIQ